MSYTDFLKQSAKRFGSIVCLGLDPVVESIPIENEAAGKKIVIFYERILEAIQRNKVYCSAVKPNYAFYAQYGIEGIQALVRVISLYKEQGFPIILDVKRGDIGTTAEAYAREAFSFFNADAVTLSPYLGYDSIAPFVKAYPGKGIYVLNKTSNKSSGEIQDVKVGNERMFLHVSRKIVEWHSEGMGAVVGATYPEELGEILGVFNDSGKEIPLLIPGVGKQGGDVAEVVRMLKASTSASIHRINSSSAINYAYRDYPGMDYAEAAAMALAKLNDQINGAL